MRGVLARDQIAARVKCQFSLFDAPEILDAEALENHRSPTKGLTGASA
jgi:hypothetical protein